MRKTINETRFEILQEFNERFGMVIDRSKNDESAEYYAYEAWSDVNAKERVFLEQALQKMADAVMKEEKDPIAELEKRLKSADRLGLSPMWMDSDGNYTDWGSTFPFAESLLCFGMPNDYYFNTSINPFKLSKLQSYIQLFKRIKSTQPVQELPRVPSKKIDVEALAVVAERVQKASEEKPE